MVSLNNRIQFHSWSWLCVFIPFSWIDWVFCNDMCIYAEGVSDRNKAASEKWKQRYYHLVLSMYDMKLNINNYLQGNLSCVVLCTIHTCTCCSVMPLKLGWTVWFLCNVCCMHMGAWHQNWTRVYSIQPSFALASFLILSVQSLACHSFIWIRD